MERKNNLNFKYYSYEKDLFAEIISKQPEVYIFANYNDLKKALEYYQSEPLSQQSRFYSLKEFREKIFSSKKILLKEEKIPLLLYSVLDKEEKKDLGLDSYNDIYQFSAQFFSYFKLLQDYQLTKIKGLVKWQQQRAAKMAVIKDKYQQKLKQLGYTDLLSLREEKNLNLQFLKDFKKINFFNIVDFSPYSRELLIEMNQEFEINLHLQLKKGDFDEQKLEIKKLTLAEKINKIEIRQTNSKLKNLAALLNEKEESKTEVQILDAGNKIDSALILSDHFNIESCQSMSETNIYKLLDSLFKLYQKGKKSPHILIELKELYNLSTQKLFKKWLDFNTESLQKIEKLMRNDYFYLDLELIENKLPELKPLFSFLKDLRKIKDISDLTDLITKISDFALQAEVKEAAEKFNDTLLELKSIEELGVVQEWQYYFSDKGSGLFSLFLNHLSYKSISFAVNEEAVDFFTLEKAPQLRRKKLLFNNLIQEKFAQKKDGLYFLGGNQLRENGVFLKHKKQLLKKYKFIRHILNAEESIIFTAKNEAENISPAVILEELALEYNLNFKESSLNSLSEKEILNNLFNYQSKTELELNKESRFNQNLNLEKNDFGSSFNFSYYKYEKIRDCYHRFYLEEIAKLDTTLEIEASLSLMGVGILSHDIFGELMIYARDNKIDPKNISAEIRQKIIQRAVAAKHLKIDRDYLKYYQRIIFKTLENSFIHFAELLQKYLPENYRNILVEWPGRDYQFKRFFKTQAVDFYLSGRIDLLLLNQSDYFIIDFKTGSGSSRQLDFYSLMLRKSYQEKLAPKSRKAIYNIFEEAFEHSYNNLEKEDSLGEEIQQLTALLLEAGEYERIYKSRCQRCPYKDICRVEVLTNEESY